MLNQRHLNGELEFHDESSLKWTEYQKEFQKIFVGSNHVIIDDPCGLQRATCSLENQIHVHFLNIRLEYLLTFSGFHRKDGI